MTSYLSHRLRLTIACIFSAGLLVIAGCQDSSLTGPNESVSTPPDASASVTQDGGPSNADINGYEADLQPIDGSGVTGKVAVKVRGTGDAYELGAKVEARGLTPEKMHPQHIHADGGILDTPCGLAGASEIPLDSDLSNTSSDTYPTANVRGQIHYQENTQNGPDDRSAHPLEGKIVILHGKMGPDGDGGTEYNPGAPVACGTLESVSPGAP